MPPKAASITWPPRRTSRNTARKSIPNSIYTTPIKIPARSAAAAAAATASVIQPPSTVIPAIPESSQKILPVDSGDTENTPQTPSHARTVFSQTQPQNSQKDRVTNSGMVKSDIDRITTNNNAETETSVEPENKTFEHFGPEKTIHLADETVVGSGDGARNEAILSSVQVPHVKDESSIQPVPGPERVASGVAVSAKGTRKIVKKTVRVVKKVIKKRVPKRVLMSGSENQGLVEKGETGVKLNEVTESSNLANNVTAKSNLVGEVVEKTSLFNEVNVVSHIADEETENWNLVNDVIEKSNLADGVTEKTSLVNEVMQQQNITKSNRVDGVTEKTSIVNEVMETSKLNKAACVLEPIACRKGNDVINIDPVVAEASKFNSGARVSGPGIGDKGDLSCIKEMETSKVNVGTRVPQQIVCEKGDYPSDIHSMETDNTKSNDAMTDVDIKDLKACNPDSMEVEKINYAAKSTTESERTKEIRDYVMESASKDSVAVNQIMDIVNKEDVGLVASQNVGPVGDKVFAGEKNGNIIGNLKKGNGEVENDIVGLNEGLLLSGEMEALERKKRRKTEIFVGGLDKGTKEDDIRKVFEETGKILEVRLVMNSKTGKNKGFAFVWFATAADAKNALTKHSKIEICGKQCSAAPVEGNDTIFLGNIDRNWKTEDVEQLLEKADVEKIDKVTLKADPNNIEKNRGFAFVELETSKDAQIAFNKLHKKNVFGNNLKIKVAWAQPLIEPAEEEILKVKSVYAEYLPSSWEEGKVKEYFKKFGEIESVVLAKDLPSSRRKDFAFINYTTRDAALTCIEAVGRDKLEDDSSKVKMTASLAKPIKKRKQHVSNLTSKQLSKEYPKASQATIKQHEPRNKGKLARGSYGRAMVNTSSSTDTLVHFSRQETSSNHIPPPRSIGPSIPDHHFPLPGSKRPFSLVGHDPLYLEPWGLPQRRIESSYPISGPSMEFFPYHHHQGPGFTSESVNGRNMYPSHFQTREQAPYYGNYSAYRRN
ncbi:hypothetical protein Pfo_000042 [Paulownia fortunei]|nr:hypothetical protein Pfo_000042 [Paulownia fortunei]